MLRAVSRVSGSNSEIARPKGTLQGSPGRSGKRSESKWRGRDEYNNTQADPPTTIYNANRRLDRYTRWPRVRTLSYIQYLLCLGSSFWVSFSQSHATSACSRSSKKERRASATDRVRMASRTATISSCLTGMGLSSVQDTYVLSLPRIHSHKSPQPTHARTHNRHPPPAPALSQLSLCHRIIGNALAMLPIEKRHGARLSRPYTRTASTRSRLSAARVTQIDHRRSSSSRASTSPSSRRPTVKSTLPS
jgi:hypothetical protein